MSENDRKNNLIKKAQSLNRIEFHSSDSNEMINEIIEYLGLEDYLNINEDELLNLVEEQLDKEINEYQNNDIKNFNEGIDNSASNSAYESNRNHNNPVNPDNKGNNSNRANRNSLERNDDRNSSNNQGQNNSKNDTQTEDSHKQQNPRFSNQNSNVSNQSSNGNSTIKPNLVNRIQEGMNKFKSSSDNQESKEAVKDTIKDNAKEVASNTGKKVASTAGNAAKAGAKAAGQAVKTGFQTMGQAIVSFVASNPWILAVLGVLLIILIIFLLIMGSSNDDDSVEGYYAKTCDFTVLNESELIYVTFGGLNASDSEESFDYEEYTLKSLVSLKAYYELSEINYSELSNSVIEAYLVLVQTNIIFASWDDPTSEDGNIHYQASDDLRCVQYLMNPENNLEYASYCYGYTGGEFDESLYEKIQSLYDSVESNIFVSSNYGGYFRQETAYDSDYISYSNSELESMLYTFENYGSSNIETILTTYYQNDYYNNLYADYYLFSVEDDCTYYTLTDNTSYWWPIGSATETATNIYGGTPTSTVINSSFGARDMSDYGGSSANQHNGIDIDGEMGETIVIAALSGTVIATNDTCSSTGSYGSTCGGGLGNYVKIEHEDGTVTIYGHMYQGSITVSEKDTVEQGQMIGLVGSSGSSTGAHLHFGVQVNGEYVDPLDYVSTQNPRPVSSTSSDISYSYVSSSTNKGTVCQTLLASGYSASAVAGLMVNIYAESGYNPMNLQNTYESSLGYSDTTYTMAVNAGTYSRSSFVTDSAGYGLAQWTSSGKKGRLYDYADSYSSILSIGDIEMQLEFLISEMTSSTYAELAKYLTGTYSAYDVAYAFCTKYEKPKDTTTTCTNRATNYAEELYTYVANGCSE